MLSMDIIAEVRRRHLVSGETISAIARSLKLSRPTVRKHLRSTDMPTYQRQQPPPPKLGEFQEVLQSWLDTDRHLPRAQRRTARRLFEGLQLEGYRGAYDSVQRYVKQYKATARPSRVQAFIPLLFAPGEACQFDWSQEHVEIAGAMQTVRVAQFRLCHSRKMFVVAYPRETQEMVFDAHNRAFAFFGGVPQRVIYDNLKTAVDKILVGKDRIFNRRFLALVNHYLFEPVACTAAAGWEKGQVENQVGNIREWLFTPVARFASFADLNQHLAMRCEELTQRKHPTERSRSIAECFVIDQAHLRVIDAPFDGYVEQMQRVSSTCVVHVDRNGYSVPAQWAGKAVSVRRSADQIRIVIDSQLIAQHERCFGRDQLICDPWHYLPVLEKKPGALRNGAPFLTWDLPEPIKQVRGRLLKLPRGDRAFVDLLLIARDSGLEALQVACELALESGVINGSHVMNELRRLTSPPRPAVLSLPESLRLTVEPIADCQRYEQLQGVHHAY